MAQQELESAKPHVRGWACPCLGRAPFTVTELRKKFPSAWRVPRDAGLSVTHCTATTLLPSPKARLCVSVRCPLSRTRSSCSGQGCSFFKGEKLAQPTYVPVIVQLVCRFLQAMSMYVWSPALSTSMPPVRGCVPRKFRN